MVCPILVGRDEALAALRAALRAGRSAPVLRVYGEAGIGKSRLVSQALRSLPDRRVLRTASFEADRFLPLAPFLDLLKDPSLAGEPLLARIGELARQGERQSSAGPELLRRQLFDELANIVFDKDSLLVIEDLHWSDEASLDALMHLARGAGVRTRLLVTYRDDEMRPALESFLASLDRSRLAMDVPLRRLERDEVASMAEATTGTRPGRRLLDLLLEVTDGNPFFVEEVLGALGGELATGTVSDEVPIPRTVQEAVRRRFDRLGPDAGRLAYIAAAVGRRFDLDLMANLLPLSEPVLLDAVHELVKAQLAVPAHGGMIEFRHELTRRAIYDRLIGWERRRLHLAIAEVSRLAHDPCQEKPTRTRQQ